MPQCGTLARDAQATGMYQYHEYDCSVDNQEEIMEYSNINHMTQDIPTLIKSTTSKIKTNETFGKKRFLYLKFQVRVNMVRTMNMINYFVIFYKCISSNTI